MAFCLILPFAAFGVFLFWRLCEKAGYSGALSLITLIPGIGVLILLCILAFDTWPRDKMQFMMGAPVYPPQAQPYPQQPMQPPVQPYAQPPLYPQPGYQPQPMQPPAQGYTNYQPPYSDGPKPY